MNTMIDSYADVVLRCGVALRAGQPVLIRTEPIQRHFALALARRAYELGAPYVHAVYGDPFLDRARLDLAREEHLTYVPSFVQPTYRTYIEENWASISLVGPEDPDVLDGVDPARLGKARKAMSIATQEWLTRVSAGEIPWNVCLYPTERWAEKVLGASDDWEERIWEELMPILRLDRDDPVAAWQDHDRELKRRSEMMDRARYDRIHFVGPGTDLHVGMRPDRIFIGGSGTAKDGRRFFANLPTEEIFSAPDAGRTEGTVRCTRPVDVMGSPVEGASFRFKDGAVVEASAEKNGAVLDQFLGIDERGRYLGEVSLVGTDSPIYKSGRVFHNILLDENATCHIALGNGYTKCVEGAEGWTQDQLRAAGVNLSLVHLDFMIGSDEVSVFGVRSDGREEKLIDNGRFVV